jgi:hypothetical protein
MNLFGVHFKQTQEPQQKHTKETTDGPFHFLHMGPMSDVTML